jgi:hypothetical protein
MFQLFKSEFLRYRTWSFLAAAVFLAVFVFVARIKPFLAPEAAQNALTNMVLIGGSIGFGLLQFLLHKRQNHWTYLVHRPVQTHKIYLALMAAGLAALAIAVCLPFLVMIAGIDGATATVVDLRHYAFILDIYLLCVIGYLVGSLAALNASKGAILLAIVLVALMVPEPSTNLAQFLPKITVIAGLVALGFHSFKPDLSRHITKPWAIAVMGGTMSMALVYGLLMSTTVIYHVPKFLMGIHPDNNPVDGTLRYYWNHEVDERPAYALVGSDHPKAAHLAKATELADGDFISVDRWSPARRGQLHTEDRSYAFEHRDTNTTWQFSHDSMLLEGRDKVSQKSAGAVGKNGFIDDLSAVADADRFAAVPMMVGDNLMATPSVLYQVNFDERRLDVKFQPDAGELMITRPQIRKNFVALATNKNILMFDKRDFLDEYEPAEVEYRIEHPVAPKGVYYVETFRMVDGYLLIYMGTQTYGFDRPGTAVVHAKLGGEAELINHREFTIFAHPKWIRHFEYFVSPSLFILRNAVFASVEPDDTENLTPSEIMGRDYPASIYWIAGILQLLAVVGTLVWARRCHLGKSSTITWAVLAAVASLPALLAMGLMTPWRLEKQKA